MLVTVGIPTRNRPQLLSRSLAAVCAQTHAELKIIVSDNNSEGPEVREIIEEYMKKDSRINVYYQSKNIGAAANFAYVLQKSKSKYFMWAADDDEIGETFIEDCIKKFMENDRLVLVAPEAQYMGLNGEKFPFFPEGGEFRQSVPPDKRARILHMIENNYGNLVYGLFKRSVLISVDEQPIQAVSDIASNEIPILLHAASQGEVCVLPEVGFYKTAPKNVYNQAKWEKKGGEMPSINEVKSLLQVAALFWYHLVAIIKIMKVLYKLDISDLTRFRALKKVWITILKHYMHMLRARKPLKN